MLRKAFTLPGGAFAALLAAFMLAGCGSFGYKGASLGYAPQDGVLSYGGNGLKKRYTMEGRKRLRHARLKDRAPRGSYSKAPKGAFSHRDYSRTRLRPEAALKMINAYRASKGLAPLRLNPKLTEAAAMHARDLARHDRISHYGSDGSDPLLRVQRTGYPVYLAAENVGTGQISLAEVFRGWKQSPGHNENLLLKGAREMGMALVVDPNTEYKTFWTLVLGSRRKG
jgi:uncharacterized protein YkwD